MSPSPVTPSGETDRLVLYADYVCPFCYLGRQSLETYRATRDTALVLDWHPFDLRARKRGPDGELDPTVDDGKDEAYFEQARRNVQRLKKQYGAEEMLDIDEVPEVDSLAAQIASFHVQEEFPEAWDAFDRGVYDALWVDGTDIGNASALADVAADVGIPSGDVEAAIEDTGRREAVFDRFRAARRDGVTGVPTFVSDGRAARGAVPPAQLERLVERK